MRRLGGVAGLVAAAAIAALVAAGPAVAGEPLRVTDVPPGWVSSDAPPSPLFAGLCGLRPRPRASTVLHTRFRDPAGLPVVDSTWYEFSTVGRARQRLRAIRRVLRNCRVYDLPLPDDDGVLITVEPVAAPPVGDERVAFVREVSLRGSTPGMRSVVIRKGRRLASVHVLDRAVPPSEFADALAVRAAARA